MGLFCGLLSPIDCTEGCLSLDNAEGYQRLDNAEDKRNHVQSSDPLEPYIFDPSCLLPDDVAEEAQTAPMSDELALLQRLDALQKRVEALEAKN